MSARRLLTVCVLASSTIVGAALDSPPVGLTPGRRVLLDAHNAYPEQGRWSNRLDRALSTGVPLAIEQDLVWFVDPATGRGRSIVSHGPPFTSAEPSLETYFLERIRPIVEAALRENKRDTWPLITLNLDFKDDEPEHLRAIWNVLGAYESWLCTTERRARDAEIGTISAGPLLVLTGESDAQQRIFHDEVPMGGRLRLFGAVHRTEAGGPGRQTNYRRWWNNPWSVVEPEGQPQAGAWDSRDEARLTAAVRAAHRAGLWIRFYTLDGYDPADTRDGWSSGYNFGSQRAAEERWRAAIRAGVDFVAVDQYEAFASVLHAITGVAANAGREAPLAASRQPTVLAPSSSMTIEGTITDADNGRLLERTFEVPAGVERIDVRLAYDERERTVIDLGLRGPSGFRGWSGGGPQHVWVARYSAGYGYTPGSIEPGSWHVLLGVPNIRRGVSATYRLQVDFNARPERPVVNDAPGWYAGDFHAHSGHSDGRTISGRGQRVPVPPEHVFEAARAGGLDFIALTDHNTTSHWLEVDRLQQQYPFLLLLHAREVTTYRGHMNALGEQRFIPFAVAPDRPLSAIVRDLTAAGAFVSINHPMLPGDERCMGCGWMDRDDPTIGGVHAVEIVNGETAEGPLAGWTFFAEMLGRGHHLVPIGGSDDHSPDDVIDKRIGRPTTMVYADSLSEDALLDGLRRGRVYVRTRGVDGPGLDFEAISGGQSYPMGTTLSACGGEVTLKASVDGAEGQRIDWVRNGTVIQSTPIGGADRTAQIRIASAAGDWFALVLRDRSGPTAFSGAIYCPRR